MAGFSQEEISASGLNVLSTFLCIYVFLVETCTVSYSYSGTTYVFFKCLAHLLRATVTVALIMETTTTTKVALFTVAMILLVVLVMVKILTYWRQYDLDLLLTNANTL
uniref:Uncharacterized protein n=1 Tax=Glossina pallidipes TaxID=7398 RepID=A0A1B0AIW6_GLOPL